MCVRCYEAYGSPTIVNEKTQHAAKLIEKVYDYSPVGGNAHIALDDWNLGDNNILWCIDSALTENVHESTAEELATELECLRFLLGLTIEERASALAIYDGFLETETPPPSVS